MKKLFIALFLAFVLAGCTSYHGNFDIINSDMLAKIVPYETTKLDTKRLFGEPTSIDFDGGDEIWKYSYKEYTLFVGGTEQNLIIKFNGNGVVLLVEKSKLDF